MSRELQNIPFYWTAIAHWMSLTVYGLLLPRRWNWIQEGLLAAATLLGLNLFMHVTEPQNGAVFNLLMACFAMLTMVPLALGCRLKPEQTAYYAANSFILGGFTCSLAWQLYTYFTEKNALYPPRWAEVAVMLAIYALTGGAVYLILRRWMEAAEALHLSRTACVSTVVMAVVIYILSSLSFAPIDTPFGGSTYAEAFNIRTLVYLGGLAVLFAHHVTLCDSYVTLERDSLKSILDTQYLNYKLSQESVDLVNQKYHDLKHQIHLLRSEAGEGMRLDRLDRLEQEIRVYEAQNKTGNQVLDTILTGKSLHCQKEGISFTCVADGGALDFMDAVDMSVLFGNALDNAIEAASQIPDPEQRLIHLSVNRQKGFVRIRLENRFQGKLRLNRGLPVTTKADERYHGFGVKSIAATAEKYGGSATFSQREGWFELRILLPVPQ